MTHGHTHDERREDALLAIRAQLGEADAFDALVRRWGLPLRRYALTFTDSGDAADDLVQEIWLGAVRGLARLRDPMRFRSWLFGIAHRTAMNRLRGRYRKHALHDDGPLPDIADADDPESPMEREATLNALSKGLTRLKATERQVLQLFYLEQLTIAEIAGIMAVPPGTVKSRLFRARSQLKTEVELEMVDDR
ncbi:RNA polymerase sigma factor [Alteriqipengyuania sp.]|uniref:RNA polymerase sigma factor n=1 Tax=Alteriqipengyuania sp. TaxID=2800692 RepID=UPI0035156A7A